MTVVRVLSNNSTALLKLICSDSCDGHSITTMLGLSLLGKLVDVSPSGDKLVRFIADKGYLSCIVNSLHSYDNRLLDESFNSPLNSSSGSGSGSGSGALLANGTDKCVYVVETKLAFLNSLASTSVGAQHLLKSGLVNALTACTIYSLRAKFDRHMLAHLQQHQHQQQQQQQQQQQTPHHFQQQQQQTAAVSYLMLQLLHRYYQVFLPTLDLCIGVLNALGAENVEARAQVGRFVLTFAESFVHVLTSRPSDVRMLDELRLVTNLMCQLAPFDALKQANESVVGSIGSAEANLTWTRIQKEMIGLVALFLVPEQLRQLKKEIEHPHHHHQQQQHASEKRDQVGAAVVSAFAEIASNVSSFCTITMGWKSGSGAPAALAQLIFSPSIDSHQLHPCKKKEEENIFFLKKHFLAHAFIYSTTTTTTTTTKLTLICWWRRKKTRHLRVDSAPSTSSSACSLTFSTTRWRMWSVRWTLRPIVARKRPPPISTISYSSKRNK